MSEEKAVYKCPDISTSTNTSERDRLIAEVDAECEGQLTPVIERLAEIAVDRRQRVEELGACARDLAAANRHLNERVWKMTSEANARIAEMDGESVCLVNDIDQLREELVEARAERDEARQWARGLWARVRELEADLDRAKQRELAALGWLQDANTANQRMLDILTFPRITPE